MTKPCRCHSSYLYASLTTCPKCGHNSFEDGRRWGGNWGGCERKACGYEVTYQRTESTDTSCVDS